MKIIQNVDPNLRNLYLGINFKQMFSVHWGKPTERYKSIFEYGELIKYLDRKFSVVKMLILPKISL